MKKLKKKVEESYEQTIYEVFYSRICPICKIECREERRLYDSYDNKPPIIMNKTIIECRKCGVALIGKRCDTKKIVKTYPNDELDKLLN